MRKLFALLFIISFSFCNNSPNTNYSKDKRFTINKQEFKTVEAKEYNDTALFYLDQDKPQKALHYLNRAALVESDNPVIYNNMGNIEKEYGNLNASIRYFEKSLKVSQNNYPPASVNLALSYQYNGQPEEAIKILLKTLEKKPNELIELSSYLTLTMAYSSIGECELSKEYLRKAKAPRFEPMEVSEQIKNIEEKIKNCVQYSL